MKTVKTAAGSIFALALILGTGSRAWSSVTLVDHDGWKAQMGGFAELDLEHDNTRSFNEAVGNGPVARGGGFDGDNGRTVFSGRNSRLSFTVVAPPQEDWKSKGYFEMDFLGYEPAISTAAPKNAESSFYSNPAIRVRHLYFTANKDEWSFLAGQTWSLFGWEPNHILSTLSVSPGPGILFQRTLQLAVMKTWKAGEQGSLQGSLSLERPSQRDSETPNLNAGLRYSCAGRKSGFAGASSNISAEPMGVALTGSLRQFAVPQDAANTSGKDHKNASAYAVDLLLPILASSDGASVGNTLTLTAEYSAGTGYADALPGWTGNLAGFPNGANTTIPGNLNLDAGQGGFDAGGSFELAHLQTWSSQLQYHFPQEWHAFATLGASQTSSNNVDQLTGNTSGTIYTKAQMSFFNVIKDLTEQIRVGAEYEHLVTTYVDDLKPANDRYQLTAYFRF